MCGVDAVNRADGVTTGWGYPLWTLAPGFVGTLLAASCTSPRGAAAEVDDVSRESGDHERGCRVALGGGADGRRGPAPRPSARPRRITSRRSSPVRGPGRGHPKRPHVSDRGGSPRWSGQRSERAGGARRADPARSCGHHLADQIEFEGFPAVVAGAWAGRCRTCGVGRRHCTDPGSGRAVAATSCGGRRRASG
jgi:hypothetical protein